MTIKDLMRQPYRLHDPDDPIGGVAEPELEEPETEEVTPPPVVAAVAEETPRLTPQQLLAQLNEYGYGAVPVDKINEYNQRQEQRTETQEPPFDPYDPDSVQKWMQSQTGAVQQDTESAVLTRFQLADQAERQIRSEFPGLPDDDVQRIKNAFFDKNYSAAHLQESFNGKTHMAYAALAYQEASKAGKVRQNAVSPMGKSPTSPGGEGSEGISAAEKPTYEKWLDAFGRAYMKDGKLDHKLARQRFRETVGAPA